MGDILDVCSVYLTNGKNTNGAMQLHPASSQENDALNNVLPARLTICGQVIATQTDIRAFILTIRQNICGADEMKRLRIRACMGFQTVWPVTPVPLPNPNDIVSFLAVLTTFVTDVAVVTLDDMAIIPHLLMIS
jgi:hypothetical protein